MLRSTSAVRAGSPRRWAAGAVIAATLLAEVPHAPDRTPDHAPDGAADPCAACDRSAAGAPPRSPPAPVVPLPAAASGSVGTSHRPTLRHVIGL
ncbi:MAG TPA: hypothetical protein VF516_12455 [Kofleriaceae bacterium]